MAKTLRLQSTYNGNGPNTIVTVNDTVAAALLAGNIGATTDLTGGVYPANNQPNTIKQISAKPTATRQLKSSIMYLGDSISAATVGMAHLPRNTGTRNLSPTLTNLNSGGFFVIQTYVSGATPTGNGTLRFYAADKTMTWQASGDPEGPRVKVTSESIYYRLDSGLGEHEMYLSIVPRLIPTADKADTVSVSGTVGLRNNAASNGVVGWTNTLLGPVFDDVYVFAVSTIRASDWLLARSQWEGIYTEVTHIFLGTNDLSTRASALQLLSDMETIIRARLDIGSRVVVGALLPFDARTADNTRAAVEYNVGLRNLCERLGVALWDAWPYVGLASGSGAYAPGLSDDGLHPTSKGGYIIAKRGSVPLIKPYARTTQLKPFAGALYDATTAPYGNLLPNPQLTGTVAISRTGITGEEPTSWGCYRGSGTTITAVSKAPDSAGAVPMANGIQGKYWTVTISNANASNVSGESITLRPAAFVTTGWAVGDYIVFEGEFRLTGSGIQNIKIQHNIQGGIAPVSYAIDGKVDSTTPADNLDGDTITVPFKSWPILIESYATSMSVTFTVMMQSGGTATIDISPAGLSLHKVPAPV